MRAALCIFGAAHLVACGGQSENSTDSSRGGSNVAGATSLGGAGDSGAGSTSHGDAGSSNEAGTTSPGGGGTSGGDASVGAGGSSGSKVPLPACLSQLFASCELKGACTVEDVNQDGSLLRYCFTSGVKVVSNKGTECSNVEDKIYASDGSLCYSRSRLAFAGHFCEGPTINWADGTGKPIATATSLGPTGEAEQISCAGGGEQARCAARESCGWDLLSASNCSVGVCP